VAPYLVGMDTLVEEARHGGVAGLRDRMGGLGSECLVVLPTFDTKSPGL
jgi:hypothetical protein